MSKPLRPNEFAEREILRELAWYEDESTGLGDRLWAEIQAVVKLISIYPGIGMIVRRSRAKGTVRRFGLRHFPFFVIYREHSDHLEIVAFAPTSRKPDYWRSRVS